MQKLVEAKLKRAYAEGMTGRTAEHLRLTQHSKDGQSEGATGDGVLAEPVSSGEAAGRADANMAALLEQVELEDETWVPEPMLICLSSLPAQRNELVSNWARSGASAEGLGGAKLS